MLLGDGGWGRVDGGMRAMAVKWDAATTQCAAQAFEYAATDTLGDIHTAPQTW